MMFEPCAFDWRNGSLATLHCPMSEHVSHDAVSINVCEGCHILKLCVPTDWSHVRQTSHIRKMHMLVLHGQQLDCD